MTDSAHDRVTASITDLAKRRVKFSARAMRAESVVSVGGYIIARLPRGRWAAACNRNRGFIRTILGYDIHRELQVVEAITRLGLLAQCDAEAYCARLKAIDAARDRDNWLSWTRTTARKHGYRLVKAKKRTAKK